MAKEGYFAWNSLISAQKKLDGAVKGKIGLYNNVSEKKYHRYREINEGSLKKKLYLIEEANEKLALYALRQRHYLKLRMAYGG